MITLLQQPNSVSFSRNPVIFEFETDSLYASMGQPYRAHMQFNQGKGSPSAFNISWKGVTISFAFVNEIIANDGRELPAYISGSISDWLDDVVAALKLNYYLDTNFIIEKHNNGSTLIFTSKENNADLNMTYTGTLLMTGVSWSVVQYAQDKVLRKNFALYLELWAEREDGNGFERYSQSTVEVANDGKAIWDVQRYLTAIILKDGPILPDLENHDLVIDYRSVRRYYIRYAEMYGDPQRITRMNQTDTFTAVLGGFAVNPFNRTLPQFFLDSFDQLQWMHGNAIQNLHVAQPAYGAIVNFKDTVDNVAIKCRLFFDDRLEEEYTLFELPEWQHNSKLVVPIGFANKLSSFTDRRNITGAMIWVESFGERISGNLEIAFSNEIRPALMPLLYLNSYGCFQTIYTYGKRTFDYNIDKTSEAFVATVRDSPILHSLRELGIKSRDGVKVNSGFLPLFVIKRFRDFILSTYKYVYLEDRWRPVVLDSNSVNESEDFENLKSIAFTVLFANEDYLWGT